MFGGGGGGLRFTLFGFPTRVDWSFFLIAAVIVFNGLSLSRSLVWVAVVAVSILIHELGHAFAARRYGATPQIALYAMGGLTSFVPPTPPTRRQSVAVSIAGPGAGFVVGMVVVAFRLLVDPVDDTLLADGVVMAMLVNLGWGLVNLVPVLPLDGGAILRELLPGEPSVRHRRAARISVAVGVVAMVAALAADLTFVVILFALFTFSNVGQASGGKRNTADDRLADSFDRLRTGDRDALAAVQRELAQVADPRRRSVLVSAVGDLLLAQGAITEVRGHVDRFPADADPALHALVAVYESRFGAVDELLALVAAEPSALGVRCLARGLLHAGRAPELLALVVAGPADLRRLAVLREMHLIVHASGAFEVARRLGELMLTEHPDAEAGTWFNVACSHSRAGALDDAFQCLAVAIDRGWADRGQLDHDPDLVALRDHPAYPALRHRLTV